MKSAIVLAIFSSFMVSSANALVTFDWVTVGLPGNAADAANNRGAVGRTYQIAALEVTNSQYVEFLNAKASAFDAWGLWNPSMSSSLRGGIARTGTPGNYQYSAKPNFENKPVNFTLIDDAARFVNWLHNGQGLGDTEIGAYNMGLTPDFRFREMGARYFLPSPDEWYKAAYFDPRITSQGGPSGNDHYWGFATRSDNTPGMAFTTSTGDIANPGFGIVNSGGAAAWNGITPNVTTVGSAGANSRSFFGTYDQTGNVIEWVQSFASNGNALRMGLAFNDGFPRNSEETFEDGSEFQLSRYGFRIARDINGDFNNDNLVDAADYTVWREQLGSTYAAADYNAWRTNFGSQSTNSSVRVASVAEPSGIAVIAVVVISLFVRPSRMSKTNAAFQQNERFVSRESSFDA